jgi:hypothetical protein
VGRGRARSGRSQQVIVTTCRFKIVFKLSENEARGLDAGEKATAQAIAKALQFFPGTDWEFKDLDWLGSDEIEVTLIKKPFLASERRR